MSTNDSFMNLWNYMEISEKQRLMQQFLKQHGDHFNREDFIRFLARRFDDTRFDVKPKKRNPQKGGRPVGQ